MKICTYSIATVKPHVRRKARAVIREYMRRSRQDFRNGLAASWYRGRRYDKPRPSITFLPIVAAPAPKLDGYGSNYRPWESRPMSSTPLDLI